MLRDFQFASGEKLPELRIHYMTLGTPRRDANGRVTNAVLIMHSTTTSGWLFASKPFAEALFEPGQPLDLTRYYVILPDDIGHGRSSKPSDGLRARFPHYGYRDMVAIKHALLTEGLHVDHLRLVMGTSMGCMHAWMWAETWPDTVDTVMPLACLPVPIVGRNWAWRTMVIDAIKDDPAWNHGDYVAQPRASLGTAADVFLLAVSQPIVDQEEMPTADAVEKAVGAAKARFLASHDANDLLYAIASSRDYDPSASLEAIRARVMFVNSADDFINPPELGIAEREIKRVAHGKFVLIPASNRTHGHSTYIWADLWKQYLVELLAPR